MREGWAAIGLSVSPVSSSPSTSSAPEPQIPERIGFVTTGSGRRAGLRRRVGERGSRRAPSPARPRCGADLALSGGAPNSKGCTGPPAGRSARACRRGAVDLPRLHLNDGVQVRQSNARTARCRSHRSCLRQSPRGFLRAVRERGVVVRLVPYLRVDEEGGIEALAERSHRAACMSPLDPTGRRGSHHGVAAGTPCGSFPLVS
jgi:hypothetical protein